MNDSSYRAGIALHAKARQAKQQVRWVALILRSCLRQATGMGAAGPWSDLAITMCFPIGLAKNDVNFGASDWMMVMSVRTQERRWRI